MQVFVCRFAHIKQSIATFHLPLILVIRRYNNLILGIHQIQIQRTLFSGNHIIEATYVEIDAYQLLIRVVGVVVIHFFDHA
ncbi:hypothetical protein D3C76_1277230 [compost metagenome]